VSNFDRRSKEAGNQVQSAEEDRCCIVVGNSSLLPPEYQRLVVGEQGHLLVDEDGRAAEEGQDKCNGL
jgi:hypothetical protein